LIYDMPAEHHQFRVFRDSEKVEWKVWEVVPFTIVSGHPERRLPVPDTDLGRASEERRKRNEERRATWEQGWLLFETGDLRKRLKPIPPEWQSATESELASMCRNAVVIK
jgi:hypothetical protein